MRRRTWVSIIDQRALNQIMIFTKNCPVHASLHACVFIRAMRSALHMSQRQLARRSGLTQCQITRLEGGSGGVELDTLRRVFDTMFCDLLILPRPPKRPGDALVERRLETNRWRRAWDD
jgi:DNA-binding Xre family transcriptional regulator